MSEIEFTDLCADDFDGVHSLWSDEEATLFTNFPYLPTKDECRQRLGKMLAYYGQNPNHFGPYVIRSKVGEFLGLTGGDEDTSSPGTYEIWYFVQRDHWGKKVATTAVRHLLELMHRSGRVKRYKAEAVVENEPSWRFLEKLGFHRVSMVPAGHKKGDRTWDRYVYSKEISSGPAR
ncbi:MAG: GNAT family N-acetyltransferase [Bdellovibrionia bacterium]